jgi:acid phosphatase
VDTAERAGCQANDVPSGTTSSGPLLDDVRGGTLPVTGELTPNLCNDAHDCSLGTADAWLAGWVPILMAGPDYRSGHLTIIVTFDEDDGSQSNHVPFVVIDPQVKTALVTARVDHYSLTRWLDDNAGVTRLRNAASAFDLRAAFGL